MKIEKMIAPTICLLGLGGCQYFTDGFSYEEINSSMDGLRIVSEKQFTEKNSALIAKVSFSCDPKKKELRLALSSFKQTSEGKEKNVLPGSAFHLTEKKLPIGRFKAGEHEAISIDKIVGFEIGAHSNVLEFDVGLARVYADWLAAASEKSKIAIEIMQMEKAVPALNAIETLESKIRANTSKFEEFAKRETEKIAGLPEGEERGEITRSINELKDELAIESDRTILDTIKKENAVDVGKYSALMAQYKSVEAKTGLLYGKLLDSQKEMKKMKSAVLAAGGPDMKMSSQELIEGSRNIEGVVLLTDQDVKKFATVTAGSVSDGDYIKKWGTPISFQYKASDGDLTLSIDMNDKNLIKTINSCQ
jgi:hypothetical protein